MSEQSELGDLNGVNGLDGLNDQNDLEHSQMIILTGMSGAGRSTTANVLEDLGWYVVDNLPPQLIVHLLRLTAEAQVKYPDRVIKTAAVVDVRGRWFFEKFAAEREKMHRAGVRPTMVFLDATDEELVRRFESVRRPHPLQDGGRLLDGITRERAMLLDLRSEADIVIDSSGLNVHQLSAKVASMFAGTTRPVLRLAVMSFGFKYGLPLDADIVFDMRFLPNPFWVPELRAKTGQSQEVSAYVLEQPGAQEFVERVDALMVPVIEGYLSEGRKYATLAVGCTGGKHRSVAVAERLATTLAAPRVDTFLVHRDLGRE